MRALCVLAALLATGLAARPPPVYHNEFAVHVPDGAAHVDAIASKHGFINRGQIGSLKGYYLLSHDEISRRSPNASMDHHKRLKREPQVRWVMQQHEKTRIKRDFSRQPELVWPPGRHRTYNRALSQANPFFPDPLYKEQWYLNGGAKDGLDMNVQPAWARGYTGKGVVVSILDDGIQSNHPDLAQNYDPIASTDINDSDEDPTPRDNGDNKHGTRCAGEVAAVAYNLICGVGIAYNASVGGVRMLDGIVNDAVEARALGLNPDHIDIYSASWGPEDDGKTVDGPGPLARRAFIYGVTSGRRGRGSIFVWASGNGGRHTDSCNCDGYTNSIFTLSISSATQGGFKPWYLEECSSTLASTYSSGTPGHDKSVATVDMDGRLRPDHICTVEHTGTSASAPLAAGICALALEANPNLTWRDMQYLVVMTSRSQPLERETGWIVNGVKRKVSHKFGYGLMDAAAMVTLAERWQTVPPQHICKSQEINEERVIDPLFGYTLTTQVDVTGCRGTVNEVKFLEHVQCKISLRFFPRGNLRILLKSPSGTKSTLLFERPRDIVSSNFDDWPFLSVHYWGEPAEGQWTLEVVNSGNRHVNQPGILKKWQLIFYGTSVDPIRLRKTTPNAQSSFSFPTAGEVFEQSDPSSDTYYSADTYSNYQNFPLFGAGSEPEKAVASLDGSPAVGITSALHDKKMETKDDCDPECESTCYGSGPTKCVACRNFRMDETCVSRCPPKSYVGDNKDCVSCHESCDTCVSGGQDACLTCAPHHLLIADLGVCLQQCPDGYYEDRESNKCVPCASHCSQCSEGPDMCTACDGHLVLVGKTCLAACPAGTYETAEETCASCDISCESCVGPSQNQCVTCRVSLYSHEGTCVASCPARHYADKKRRECMPCDTGCASCSSGSCIECDDKWTLNKKGRCMPEGNENCEPGEYYDGDTGICHLCAADCALCSGDEPNSCLSCRSPLSLQNGGCVGACAHGLYAESGRCVRCPHSCSKCTSRINCTECTGDLKIQSGACVSHCAKGYYTDRDHCVKCHLSCDTCLGGARDSCVTCPFGWRLAAGECHPECLQGFYNQAGECRRCHHMCRSCNDSGPQSCTSCPSHAVLARGVCHDCPPAHYAQHAAATCAPCHATCAACTDGRRYSCTACERPLALDRLNGQCVPCCQDRKEAESSGSNVAPSCCRCDSKGECRHSSASGKRRVSSSEREYARQAGAGGNPAGSPEGGGYAGFIATVGAVAAVGAVMALAILRRSRGGEAQYVRVSGDADAAPPAADYEHEPLLEAYT